MLPNHQRISIIAVHVVFLVSASNTIMLLCVLNCLAQETQNLGYIYERASASTVSYGVSYVFEMYVRSQSLSAPCTPTIPLARA